MAKRSRSGVLSPSVSWVVFLAAAGAATAQDAVTRMSVDSSGIEGNADSGVLTGPAISRDGRYVAFESDASNLVANDNNGVADIFVHDRLTGATVRVSVDSSGAEADDWSMSSSLSKDGRFVAFTSWATNLVAGDTNGWSDVFVHDRDPDTNGVFDEGNGVTTRVSVSSSGVEGNDFCAASAISGDGSIVAFDSKADTLVANDTNKAMDVFVHDRTTGITTRISVSTAGVEGDDYSSGPSISGDGNTVVFHSQATNLVSRDTNNATDVFVHIRSTSTTRRISVSSAGVEGDYFSVGARISADASTVAFESYATNLVPADTNGQYDVFVRDRTTNTTTRVSVDSYGVEGNEFSSFPSISADGRFVAFESYADNFAPGDVNGTLDVFLHDRSTGQTILSSATRCGLPGNRHSHEPAISGDGLLVTFTSAADDLVPGDTNSADDILCRDQSVELGASWKNYGAGFPGTLGIPSLTSSANPVLGTTITIGIGNSYPAATLGVVLAGWSEDSIPTNKGGTLLVSDLFLVIATVVDGAVAPLDVDVPLDEGLCGLDVYCQVLELDDGAANGVSFTPGLKLVFGY